MCVDLFTIETGIKMRNPFKISDLIAHLTYHYFAIFIAAADGPSHATETEMYFLEFAFWFLRITQMTNIYFDWKKYTRCLKYKNKMADFCKTKNWLSPVV